jgi:activator of 2-hydroxyglutaryl-CoA dehydratase
MSEIRALGMDIGSTTTKIVGVDAEGTMVWHLLEETEPRVADQVERLLAHTGQAAGTLDEIPLVATGYGRGLVSQAAGEGQKSRAMHVASTLN